MILRRLRPPVATAAALLFALMAACQGAAHAETRAADAPATAPGKAKASPSKGEQQAEVWFKMLDSNRDNHLTWDEVKHIAPLAKDFHAADTDGNGRVSREEIRALSRKRVAERRARKAREAQAKAQSQQAPLPPTAAASTSGK